MSWLDQAWRWLETRWKIISLSALVIILIVSGGWLIVNYGQERNLMTQLEYFEIMKVEDGAARALRLEEFANIHRGKDVSSLAYMWLGSYYYDNGDFPRSAGFYNDVIQGSKGKLMQFIAIDSLAPVYIGMGKIDDAAELYLEAAKERYNPRPYLSRFKAASVFELSGNFTRAEEIYNDLIADGKTPTAIKLKAEERLLWIVASRR